ncbi:DNA helicase [Roseibium sp. HPY-6]|uniref:DNA helicase n=1 Tax=Roseibium sp. HPY-6 TaxID=3229852 RepID=UPI00338E89B3
MRLSAPIFRLKRKAKAIARQENIPLNAALDRIACSEGFANWGQLASSYRRSGPEDALLRELQPGQMLLLAARPGQGKTVLGLQLGFDAAKRGGRSFFLSSECSAQEVRSALALGGRTKEKSEGFETVLTDSLNADAVVKVLSEASEGALGVIDYLQILDQMRTAPELSAQIQTLKRFAQTRRVRLVFLSQIHRSFDPAVKDVPDWSDIRLPNPLDLSLFDKGCFLHEGEMVITTN